MVAVSAATTVPKDTWPRAQSGTTRIAPPQPGVTPSTAPSRGPPRG